MQSRSACASARLATTGSGKQKSGHTTSATGSNLLDAFESSVEAEYDNAKDFLESFFESGSEKRKAATLPGGTTKQDAARNASGAHKPVVDATNSKYTGHAGVHQATVDHCQGKVAETPTADKKGIASAVPGA